MSEPLAPKAFLSESGGPGEVPLQVSSEAPLESAAEGGWDPQPISALRAHLPFLLGAALIVTLALLFQVTPDGAGITVFGARLPESCLLKSTTGHGCPGCGLTRSFVTGVRLDPQAFRFHALGPLLLLIVAAQLPYRAYKLWQGAPVEQAARPSPWPLYVLGLLALGLVAVWGARISGVLPQ